MESIIRRLPHPDPAQPHLPVLRCALTGHRPQKLPFGTNEEDPRCADFKRRIASELEMLVWEGYAHFLSGGALGFDLYAAEEVLTLRSRYPWIALEIVIPFDDQAALWPERYRQRYLQLLSGADIITYTGHRYTRDAYAVRNRYLVEHCDLLLAAFDGRPGGTAATCRYAAARHVPLTTIPPVVLRASA